MNIFSTSLSPTIENKIESYIYLYNNDLLDKDEIISSNLNNVFETHDIEKIKYDLSFYLSRKLSMFKDKNNPNNIITMKGQVETILKSIGLDEEFSYEFASIVENGYLFENNYPIYIESVKEMMSLTDTYNIDELISEFINVLYLPTSKDVEESLNNILDKCFIKYKKIISIDKAIETNLLVSIYEKERKRVSTKYKYHLYLIKERNKDTIKAKEIYKDENYMPCFKEERVLNIDDINLCDIDNLNNNFYKSYDSTIYNNFTKNRYFIDDSIKLANTYINCFKDNNIIDDKIIFFINDLDNIILKYNIDKDIIKTNTELQVYELMDNPLNFKGLSEYILHLSKVDKIPYIDILGAIINLIYNKEYSGTIYSRVEELIKENILYELLDSIITKSQK